MVFEGNGTEAIFQFIAGWLPSALTARVIVGILGESTFFDAAMQRFGYFLVSRFELIDHFRTDLEDCVLYDKGKRLQHLCGSVVLLAEIEIGPGAAVAYRITIIESKL